MEQLRDQLEHAFDEVVTRLQGVEAHLGPLRQSVAAHMEGLRAADRRSGRMIELLLALPEAVAGDGSSDSISDQLIEGRMHLEAGLRDLRDEVAGLRATPVPVDTHLLEAAADRGALRNAADIAGLKRNIDALAEAVRAQDAALTELRTTLDWIKERLLIR